MVAHSLFQIRSRKQLARLRLASRTFDAAVAPFLFYEINVGKKGIQSLRAVAESGHLRHVRKLSVEYGYLANEDDYQEVVQQMLPKLPLLESFTYVGLSCLCSPETACAWVLKSSTDAGQRWVDLPLATRTLSILHKSCPSIKSVCLAFPENMGEQVLGYVSDREYDQPEPGQLRSREIYGSPDLAVVAGLEELALDDLCEELPWWKSQLVRVLESSPGLRKLKLSLSVDTVARYARYNERDKFDSFFDELCEDYGETGAAPLRLHALELGTAVYPYQRGSLEKLTDLAYLREVHIRNKGVYQFGDIILPYGYDDEESGIAFEAFGPTHCPNLRRFTAADYRGDVHNLFATIGDASFARQLAVSCGQMGGGYELAALLRPDPEHPHLPLHLRMIDIDLEREQIFLFGHEHEQLPETEIPSAGQVLADLVSGDDGTLEGLAVHLPEDPDAEGGFRHLDLLTLALTKLVNITQLSIVSNYSHHTELTSEMLMKAACMLAAAARSLLFIRVYGGYWRVWRGTGGAIKLEELEDREITDVELFGHSIWEPEAQ